MGYWCWLDLLCNSYVASRSTDLGGDGRAELEFRPSGFFFHARCTFFPYIHIPLFLCLVSLLLFACASEPFLWPYWILTCFFCEANDTGFGRSFACQKLNYNNNYRTDRTRNPVCLTISLTSCKLQTSNQPSCTVTSGNNYCSQNQLRRP